MKKKQFMSKLAALTMAAAMGITALPATVMAADEVPAYAAETSVPASNAAISDSTYVADNKGQVKITIDATTEGTLSDATKTAVFNATKTVNDKYFKQGDSGADQLFDSNGKYNNGKTEDAAKKAIAAETGLTGIGAVDNINITDPDNWSFDITVSDSYAQDKGSKLHVVVATGHTYSVSSKVTDILDDYFTNTVYTSYSGKTFTNNKIAADLNASTDASYGDDDDQTAQAALTALGVTVSGATGSATDGKGKITLTVAKEIPSGTANPDLVIDGKKTTDDDFINSTTPTNVTVTYDYTLNLNKSDKTADQALADAIAAVNGTTYADPQDEGKLENKIAADLKEAGATDAQIASLNVPGGTYKKATKDADGSWYLTVKDTVLKVTTTYSSKSKLNDTDKSVKKALIGATKKSAAKWDDNDGNDAKDINNDVINVNVYDYAQKSKFSVALQPKNATKATSLADVKAAVEKQITDQLTADGIAENGVKVDVSELTSGSNKSVVAATGTDDSTYNFIVRASIRNDFNGWATSEKKYNVANYYVTVQTAALKEVEYTAVALDDKTFDLVADVDTDNDGVADAQLVTIDPTRTPENANEDLTWKIKNKNGQDVTTQLRGVYYVDGQEKTLDANQFLFKTGGKYTVEVNVTSDKTIKASATYTVLDSFEDAMVPTSFYYAPVKWAKAQGVASGISSMEFGVGQTVSRAQFVTWLYRLAQKASPIVDVKGDVESLKFSDVSKDAYYAEAVAWASEEGIAAGTSATTFNPNAPVTRAQAATFLYRFNGKAAYATGGNKETDNAVNFNDVTAGSYYEEAVTWAATRGVVAGITTTTFAPDRNATREQSITMIWRIAGRPAASQIVDV